MLRDFDGDIETILGFEGGFTEDPRDSGGATQMGITQATLAAWRRTPVTSEDVRNLPRREAIAIYRTQYADKVAYNDLPRGLALVMFDYAVNSGPAQAAKTLQDIVGVTPDGIIGALTLAEVAKSNVASLLGFVCDRRLALMKSLSAWATFGDGWTKRVETLRTIALAQVDGSGPVVPLSLPQVAAKADPTTVKVTATKSGKLSIVALFGALGAGASTIAVQIAPFTGFRFVQYLSVLLLVFSTIAGLMDTISKLKRGETPA